MCSIEVAFSLHLHTPSSVDAYGLQHISEDAYRNLCPCLLQVANARAAGYAKPLPATGVQSTEAAEPHQTRVGLVVHWNAC
jgi:hypothetical protein